MGTLVTIRWTPAGDTKRALFVRSTRTGKIVVRVEGVTAKGEPTGEYGSPRTFERHDLVAVAGR